MARMPNMSEEQQRIPRARSRGARRREDNQTDGGGLAATGGALACTQGDDRKPPEDSEHRVIGLTKLAQADVLIKAQGNQ